MDGKHMINDPSFLFSRREKVNSLWIWEIIINLLVENVEDDIQKIPVQQ